MRIFDLSDWQPHKKFEGTARVTSLRPCLAPPSRPYPTRASKAASTHALQKLFPKRIVLPIMQNSNSNPVPDGSAGSSSHTMFYSILVSFSASSSRLYTHSGLPLDFVYNLGHQHCVLVADHFHGSRIPSIISANYPGLLKKTTLMVGLLGPPKRTWQPQTTVRFLSAPKLSLLKLWLTPLIPTILEVTSTTVAVATDEGDSVNLSIGQSHLDGMSLAEMDEYRLRYQQVSCAPHSWPSRLRIILSYTRLCRTEPVCYHPDVLASRL